VHFNAYGGNAGLLAAALSNLDDGCDAAAVANLLAAHRVARAQLTDRELAALRAWRLRLWEVFDASAVAEKVAIVNGLLADVAARPYVSMHDGQPPHLHYADEHADVVTRVQAATAAGLALVLAEAGPHRLGRCAAPGCRTVFVDVSRNGRRAYCSRRCATRVNVSVHRSRSRPG